MKQWKWGYYNLSLKVFIKKIVLKLIRWWKLCEYWDRIESK